MKESNQSPRNRNDDTNLNDLSTTELKKDPDNNNSVIPIFPFNTVLVRR